MATLDDAWGRATVEPLIRSASLTSSASNPNQQPPPTGLLRQVGLFDATMIVMGGIVGAGIFINPYVVAQQVHTSLLILGVWIIGGIVAMLGAFVYAELAARRPAVGGQYAYLREAFHPVVGFLYGWVLLLVIQTGGMAAVTVTFARYLLELTGWTISERLIVVVTIVALTVINCMGVKLGSRMQSVLMLLKIGAIAGLIGAGLFLVHSPHPLLHPALDRPPSLELLTAVGAAMVPVLFAFGGWQTTNFIAEEIKDPRRNLSRALVLGVAGVIILYVGVNFVCVRTLGPQGLADTRVPATAVMRVAMGDSGARLIALGIAISTLGFLSQSVLTAPRVYFAMARDGSFFRGVAKVTERYARSGDGDYPAKCMDDCSRSVRTLRTDSELRGVDGFPLLRPDGRKPVSCFAPGKKQTKSPRISRPRPPFYNWDLCVGIVAGGDQYHLQVSEEQSAGNVDSAAGSAGVCLLGGEKKTGERES